MKHNLICLMAFGAYATASAPSGLVEAGIHNANGLLLPHSASAVLAAVSFYKGGSPTLKHSKKWVPTEPDGGVTPKQNTQILRDSLNNRLMLEELESGKNVLCKQLSQHKCGRFKDLPCGDLTLADMRKSLVACEATMAQGDECNEALKVGMRLFDILAVSLPLSLLVNKQESNPLVALNTLFRSLNIPTAPGLSRVAEEETLQEVSFAELGFRRRSAAKSRASIILNWYFQALSRSAEFFSQTSDKVRPLAPLGKLLSGSAEEKVALVDRMCGNRLISVRLSSKRQRKLLFTAREYFRRATTTTGLPRVSCDAIMQAVLAVNMAEKHAISHINSVLETLPTNMLERTIPLERNAGGDVNYQRMCISLRREFKKDALLDNLTCSFTETILSEHVSSGTSASARVSLKPHEHQSLRSKASVAFDLISLRGGDITRAAKLMGEDASKWWLLLLMTESRSIKQVVDSINKSVKFCTSTVKHSRIVLESVAEDSAKCTAAWKERDWDSLNCRGKFVALQCHALLGVLSIFDKALLGTINDAMLTLASEVTCDKKTQTPKKKCSKKEVSKQKAFDGIWKSPETFESLTAGLSVNGPNLFRVVALLSGNSWRTYKDIVHGRDGLDVMFHNIALLATSGKASLLMSRLVPRFVKSIVKKYRQRGYTSRHLHSLISMLPIDFYEKLYGAVNVLVHPVAFTELNQKSFHHSEKNGKQSSPAGVAGRLDELIFSASTSGLPQKLKAKLKGTGMIVPKDFKGVDFTQVHPPSKLTWQNALKEELVSSMEVWLARPENRERAKQRCVSGRGANQVGLVVDSLSLLESAPVGNIFLVGQVTSPSKTAMGGPNKIAAFLRRVLRMPSYRTRHYTYAVINLDVRTAMDNVRTLINAYTNNKEVFGSEELFMKTVNQLFDFYQRKSRSPSRNLHGVEPSNLVPRLHPLYTAMTKRQRLQEFKGSALEHFFAHTWWLVFSVSANHIFNASSFDKIDKLFSKEAWFKTINDPYQASSFGMVLMGGDLGLKLYDEMLPTEQKRMLKIARYGSPTVFTSQMELTGNLLSASGREGVGMFLSAQAVYFGAMIRKWISKRTSDRVREILSLAALGLFFASAFTQISTGVADLASNANQTGQVSSIVCPPMGICLDDVGNAFVPDAGASSAVSALAILMKTGVMASIAVFASPIIALYNIAVSNFRILSRIEMAVANSGSLLIRKLLKSKVSRRARNLFSRKRGRLTKKGYTLLSPEENGTDVSSETSLVEIRSTIRPRRQSISLHGTFPMVTRLTEVVA